jgi:hypothetical protein
MKYYLLGRKGQTAEGDTLFRSGGERTSWGTAHCLLPFAFFNDQTLQSFTVLIILRLTGI